MDAKGSTPLMPHPSITVELCVPGAALKQNSLWFHFLQCEIWNVNNFFSNEER